MNFVVARKELQTEKQNQTGRAAKWDDIDIYNFILVKHNGSWAKGEIVALCRNPPDFFVLVNLVSNGAEITLKAKSKSEMLKKIRYYEN